MIQLIQEHTVFEPSGGLHVAALVTSPGSASNQGLLKSALAHKTAYKKLAKQKKSGFDCRAKKKSTNIIKWRVSHDLICS